MTTMGSMRIPVRFGKTVIVQEPKIVKDLIHPLLLGTNFLKQIKAILNFGTDELIIEDYHIPISRPVWCNIPPTHLASTKEIVLGAQTYSIIKVDICGPNPRLRSQEDRPKALLIRPLNNDHDLKYRS
jgi:hypothetical protein